MDTTTRNRALTLAHAYAHAYEFAEALSLAVAKAQHPSLHVVDAGDRWLLLNDSQMLMREAAQWIAERGGVQFEPVTEAQPQE